jgi:hypothetical protein
MATNDVDSGSANTFNPDKPFNPKMVSRKFITFTAAAKRTNRLILQQNYDIDEECSICLMSMLNKPVIYTPCKHQFHYKCMFAMLSGPQQYRHKCPLCRFDLSAALMKIYDDDVRMVLLVAFITVPMPSIALGVGANEVGANEVGANEVGANEVGANGVGANGVGANGVGANGVGANGVGANEVGATPNTVEPISLFDSISEEEYEDEDEDEEWGTEDYWGTFI